MCNYNVATHEMKVGNFVHILILISNAAIPQYCYSFQQTSLSLYFVLKESPGQGKGSLTCINVDFPSTTVLTGRAKTVLIS